jgi:hypothetical protein
VNRNYVIGGAALIVIGIVVDQSGYLGLATGAVIHELATIVGGFLLVAGLVAGNRRLRRMSA